MWQYLQFLVHRKNILYNSANADDISDAVVGPRSLFDMWLLDMLDMGVSKNRGIPKPSIFNRVFHHKETPIC